jgi:hypothetical protein
MHFHTNDSKHTKTFVKLVLMIFRVGFWSWTRTWRITWFGLGFGWQSSDAF